MGTTRKLVLLFLMASLASSFGTAQSGPQSAPEAGVPGPSEISEVKIIRGKGSPAVEITCTHQIIPSVTRLDGPPRLIIDLPNAELSVRRKRMEVHSEAISAVRLAQYDMRPPVVQVVVDLVKPHTYTWEVAGNRLIVHLQEQQREPEQGQGEEATVKPPTSALARSIEPMVVPTSLPNSGHVVSLASLVPGASLSGSTDITILRLIRGEVDICPGTTVSVNRSQDRPEMMLAVSTGALETHYSLENSVDSILTPDFRILLHGPGEFHYAIKVDSRGNACIRTLPRNTGSVTVSELIGNGEHEVSSGDQFVFHAGRFSSVDTASTESCGCSASATPVMRTLSSPDSDTAPLPALSPSDVHVQVDVPLVFPDRNHPEDSPVALAESKSPSGENVSQPAPPAGVVPPPSPEQIQGKPSRSGFFGKIKGFVTGMFR